MTEATEAARRIVFDPHASADMLAVAHALLALTDAKDDLAEISKFITNLREAAYGVEYKISIRFSTLERLIARVRAAEGKA